MKFIQPIVFLLSIIFFSSGCLTGGKKANDKPNVEIHEVDLDADTLPETIEIEDNFTTNGNAIIKITKGVKNKKANPKVGIFEISGHFKRIEFIDLNDDGFKQMAVYYETKDNYTNITIYKLKNDKVSNIFSATSNCEIETDFSSVLARVKISKNREGGSDCSIGTGADWEIWVYTGEKFVKER